MFQPPTESENPESESAADVPFDENLHDQSPVEDSVDGDQAFDETEFSLDQLSAAYARVIKGESTDIDGARVVGGDSGSATSGLATPYLADDGLRTEIESSTPDVDDNVACPISPESIVESILFVGVPQGVKLTTRSIAAVLRDVSPKEVTKIVEHLNSRYAAENAAYRIKRVDGGLKLELIESLLPFQQAFFGRNRSIKLSQTAIDVLAVVAYNQPITRETIDKLRSRSSGSVLNQLVRRELLARLPSKKKSDPQSFVTTEKFLEFFKLAALEDLPQSHEASDFDELAD